MEKGIKEPIKIRRKNLANGNVSLYLDIYLNGKRQYEFLRLYLIPERTRADKEKNKQTLQLANSIKAMRLVEIQNREYGFKSPSKEESSFYDYYVAMCKARFKGESTGNWCNWNSCLKHLLEYCPRLKQLKWRDIDRGFVQGFKDYLEHGVCAWSGARRELVKERPLSQNTRVSYFAKLRACCNHAYDEGIITHNPVRGIESIKTEETKRMYLTIEEIQKLYRTKCEYPNIKRAFLFSCLTGLRRSDIIKLTWDEVQQQGDFVRIIFKQKKTGGLEYLDISSQAAELLGERGKPNDHPFTDIHSPSCTNEAIKRWMLQAGIQKEITFHCARHTFAVMMLDLGTDIYTVSKLLGHREISTTQIYAKVLDKNKQAAVARIPEFKKDAE